MKGFYRIILTVVCIVAALSFLPWLYDIAFPSEQSEPFAAWSPVADCFVITEPGEKTQIYTLDADDAPAMTGLRNTDRDSLVPQMYFNQLTAKGLLPDTVAGKAVDVPTLKHAQWVFSSMPRDINKVDAGVYPIMESRPKRVDLEDPEQVFTLDGEIRFIDMKTNEVDAARSQRFVKVFSDKGFAYPAISTNANVTARKAYDDGYMLIDADHKLYHMKMQAGMPYLARIEMPEGVVPVNAFILENPDRSLIALVTTADGELYAIESEGYRPVKLPIEGVDASRQRIMVMKNLFNWMIRTSSPEGTVWTAVDADDYSLLGCYTVPRVPSQADAVARWIFPFRITFTSINDCYAYPRISDFSLPATLLWLLIIAIVVIITNKKSYK